MFFFYERKKEGRKEKRESVNYPTSKQQWQTSLFQETKLLNVPNLCSLVDQALRQSLLKKAALFYFINYVILKITPLEGEMKDIMN